MEYFCFCSIIIAVDVQMELTRPSTDLLQLLKDKGTLGPRQEESRLGLLVHGGSLGYLDVINLDILNPFWELALGFSDLHSYHVSTGFIFILIFLLHSSILVLPKSFQVFVFKFPSGCSS